MPAPEALDFYYHSPHYHFVMDGEEDRRSLVRDTQTRFARPLPAGAPGRHLDYACGPGGYLDFSRSRGWETTGVEHDATTADAARRRGHQMVLEPELDTLPERHFDFVSILHALEHVPHPTELLASLGRRLTADGTLLVEVPWLGWEYRAFGGDYSMFQAPVHVQFFQHHTMEWMAANAGLEIIGHREVLVTPVHFTWSVLNAACRRLGREVMMHTKIRLSALAFPFTLLPAAVLSRCGIPGNVRQYRLKPVGGSR